MTTHTRVASEEELDVLEAPLHKAFAAFMSQHSLAGLDEPVFMVTFKTGNVHFGSKAIEFVPPELPLVVIGTALTPEELDYLSMTGRPIFNSHQRFDNELSYELLMYNSAGDFGWVDADSFVINSDVWTRLTRPMEPGIANRAAFTYRPLGFAKTPLVCWNKEVREVLREENASLNSYSSTITHCGRASPYSISRLLNDRHLALLQQTLGTDADGELLPHDGLLDIYDDQRTISRTDRESAQRWFGPDARRTGWMLDTPILAQVVLRAVRGWTTEQVLTRNDRVSNDVIHPGASDYRARIRTEGGSETYMRRWRLTDLLEVLLIQEMVERGGPSEPYSATLDTQVRRLREEARIGLHQVKVAVERELRKARIAVDTLRTDPRFGFLS